MGEGNRVVGSGSGWWELGSGSWGVSGWQVRDTDRVTESEALALTFLDVEQNCQPKQNLIFSVMQ